MTTAVILTDSPQAQALTKRQRGHGRQASWLEREFGWKGNGTSSPLIQRQLIFISVSDSFQCHYPYCSSNFLLATSGVINGSLLQIIKPVESKGRSRSHRQRPGGCTRHRACAHGCQSAGSVTAPALHTRWQHSSTHGVLHHRRPALTSGWKKISGPRNRS